jgi:hypothetical protein
MQSPFLPVRQKGGIFGNGCAVIKVEEKRENFSPRKLRKPGERERENFCWKVTFSRENFSPEKTLI